MSAARPIKVTCDDCSFSLVVQSEDDDSAGDVIIRHGRETGHVLSISAPDDFVTM